MKMLAITNGVIGGFELSEDRKIPKEIEIETMIHSTVYDIIDIWLSLETYVPNIGKVIKKFLRDSQKKGAPLVYEDILNMLRDELNLRHINCVYHS